MLVKQSKCEGCPLLDLGQGFSRPNGKLVHGVALLGEALGEEEVAAGERVDGTAGQLLNRMIGRTTNPLSGKALKREDFRAYNVLWCRPPENVLTGAPYEEEAISHCAPYLDE